MAAQAAAGPSSPSEHASRESAQHSPKECTMDVDDALPHHPWIDGIGAQALPRTPLLIDLPHAGDGWPEGIQPSQLPAPTLARWRDVELLSVWRDAARD